MNIFVKQRLRDLRKEQHVTQAQVAAALGIAESHYQKYERGASLPNLENLQKLADFFNVSMDYIAGRTDKPEMNR